MLLVKNTYRFVAVIMAFLMFFSSIGFAIDMHYCGRTLKSVSFFGKAKNCYELANEVKGIMKSCPHHKKLKTAKTTCSKDKGCCSNKTVHIQSDQDQQVSSVDFTINQQLKQFITAYVSVFLLDEFDLDEGGINFVRYKPPIIPRDISVLHQTFLL